MHTEGTCMQDRLEALRRIGAATVHEALGQRGYVDAAIAPLDPATRIAGRAYTVEATPGDNLAIHYALSQAVAGDVIVIDYKGCMHAAAIGDVMAFSAKARGMAAIVVDGAVRDAALVVEMGFAVFARGLCITGPTKAQPGKVQVPIVLGGCRVHPGDIVVGDRDGLVVVPAAELDDVLRAAIERDAREAAIRERLAQGATTVELFGLADKVRSFGIG
jgi:4-hydroxy-4-methyl-2-oxoglutarate aldolase